MRRGATALLIFHSLTLNAQKTIVDLSKIRDVVTIWNDAHNNKDLPALRAIYSDTLIYFAKKTTKDGCIADKTKLFATRPRVIQKILKDLLITVHVDGIIYCRFTKVITDETTSRRSFSYLLLRLEGGNYQIVGESDFASDRNSRYRLSLADMVPSNELKVIPATPKKDEPEIEVVDSNNRVTYLAIGLAFTIILLMVVAVLARKKMQAKSVVKKKNLADPGVTQTEAGYVFEQSVVQRFALKSEYFKLKDWRSDKKAGKIYPEANGYPDLQYDFKLHGRTTRFAVECKYRSAITDFINISRQDQLERYHRFQFETGQHVYIVLGLGGEPSNPKEMYLMHLDDVVAPTLNYSQIQPFRKFSQAFFFDPETNRLS